MTQNSINNSASELQVDNLNLDGNTISTTNTDGNLVLTPNGTGVTSTAKNINTSGVSFDSGTNVIHRYEEGTFTPSIRIGGLQTGITYTNQLGQYTVIGNIVHFSFILTLSNKGSLTGNVHMWDMPIAASGTTTIIGQTMMVTNGVTIPAGGVPFYNIPTGGAILNLNILNAGVTSAMQNTHLTNTSQFRLSSWYRIA